MLEILQQRLVQNKPEEKKINPALDQILGNTFRCLDKGFVRLVDYMGDESSIVQAARVSYGSGTKTVREDEQLIRYLLEHGHTTPFEMVELKFHLRVPMDTWRQIIRQRTASVNEYSTRYSEAIDDKQETETCQWRLQSDLNKQGSINGKIEWPELYGRITRPAYDTETGDSIGLIPVTEMFSSPEEYLSARESDFHSLATDLYKERLNFGIAREQARKDLPLSTYTEAYWKIDLHNLLKFLSKRMDSHAQLEIREYAEVMGAIVQWGFPGVWLAHMDFDPHKKAIILSGPEQVAFQLFSNNPDIEDQKIEDLLGKRGAKSFYKKAAQLGVWRKNEKT